MWDEVSTLVYTRTITDLRTICSLDALGKVSKTKFLKQTVYLVKTAKMLLQKIYDKKLNNFSSVGIYTASVQPIEIDIP